MAVSGCLQNPGITPALATQPFSKRPLNSSIPELGRQTFNVSQLGAVFNYRDYTSVGQNVIYESSNTLAARGNGYVNVGLPQLRTFGVKAGVNF